MDNEMLGAARVAHLDGGAVGAAHLQERGIPLVLGVEPVRELAAANNGWAASCATEILERIGAAETE